MTFVVNQPPAHPQLPLSGCDKHVSLSQTATLSTTGCMWSVLWKSMFNISLEVAMFNTIVFESHSNILTSC